MNDEELKRYVEECIIELARTFLDSKERDSYGDEADFHFDLYFLLNYRNEIFWEKKSVKAATKGFDLSIYDPHGDNKPKIIIEIKYWSNEKEIAKDFVKLEASNVQERIFLYFCNKKEDSESIKSILREQLTDRPIHCILVHPTKGAWIYNKDWSDLFTYQT